jgi:hypothetical protein
MLSWPPVWARIGGGSDNRREVKSASSEGLRHLKSYLPIDAISISTTKNHHTSVAFYVVTTSSAADSNFAGSPKQDHRSDWQLGHQPSFISVREALRNAQIIDLMQALKQSIEKAKPKQKAAPAQRKRKTASSDS